MSPQSDHRALIPVISAFLFSTSLSLSAQSRPPSSPVGTRAWADFDGDGRVDLYRITPGETDVLLWNDDTGEFVDITESTGLQGQYSRSVQALDYDSDGQADLLLVDHEGVLRIFRGLGSAAFEDASKLLGLDQLPPVAAATWIDLDVDGYADLEIEDDQGGLSLLRSRGGTTFLPPVVHRRVATTSSSPPIGSTSLGGGVTSANFTLSCVNSIRDQATGQCVGVSSLPGVGKLVPMSQDLYIGDFGRVGIGTTTPTVQLDVIGSIRADGDLIFDDDNDTIQFAGAGGFTDPMITMFPSGFANPTDRMFIAESFGKPERGLRYIPQVKQFAFQETDNTPALTVDLDTSTVLIGQAFPTSHDLTIGSPGSASMILQADTDNSIESHQPSVWFSQDGGVVEGRLGMFDSANDLVLQNLYQSADIFFRVVDGFTTGTRREFEWQNTTTGGVADDVEMRLDANGNLQIDGTLSSPAADVAEYYPVAEALEPGDVVAFAGEGLDLVLAGPQNVTRLAGVVSSKPGVTLGMSYTEESGTDERPEFQSDQARFEGTGEYAVDLGVRHEIEVNGRAPLALTGRVPVKVSAENGPIAPGDLLTVSTIPGRAARAIAAGPVIGTALESLVEGQGVILVLTNQGWYSPDPGHELRALSQRLATVERLLAELAGSGTR